MIYLMTVFKTDRLKAHWQTLFGAATWDGALTLVRYDGFGG